jgi:hypothetical protein
VSAAWRRIVAWSAFVCAFALQASTASPATHPIPFTTRYPRGVPVSFGLPDSFRNTATQAGVLLVAISAPGDATVTVGAVRATDMSFAALAESARSTSRDTLLTLDPKASIHFRKFTLPAGASEETVSHLTVTTAGKKLPLALVSCELAHRGNYYTFTYYCKAARFSVYLPIFTRSARSIHFT